MNLSNNITQPTSKSEYWERFYQLGEIDWDIGRPTPVFDEWIKTCKKPLSICIMGAGNGWDAINFARKGHLVTAVDFAESAANNIKLTAEQNNLEINILHMDIFDLNKIYSNYFDIILEYTCYCAIDPSRRRDYLKMAYHILKFNGKLVGMLFPTDKDPLDESGPPFAVHPEMTIKLISEYFTLIKQEIPLCSIKSRTDREIFIIFKKNGI